MRDVDIVRRTPWGGAEFIKQLQLINKSHFFKPRGQCVTLTLSVVSRGVVLNS